MNRSLKLAGLAMVLALSMVVAGSHSALAIPSCSTVHGKACSPNGATTTCIASDGFVSNCICTFQHWVCQK